MEMKYLVCFVNCDNEVRTCSPKKMIKKEAMEMKMRFKKTYPSTKIFIKECK